MSRVLMLPSYGTVLAATDLHGNRRDLSTLIDRFRAVAYNGPACLVLCGDLVHGPAFDEADWPEHLGTFYRDESVQVLADVAALQAEFPGQVHALLGNHEHAHLGGPRVAKFHADEAAYLESSFTAGGLTSVLSWLADLPVVAVASTARVMFTHGAPHARITSAADLDADELDSYRDATMSDIVGRGPLGALLWARTTSTERAYSFMRTIDPDSRVAFFGHDPIREGHLIEREPLLCVSTSFGCHDGDKVYLEWDLARPARTAAEVASVGLRRLYPQAPTVYRTS